MKPELEVAWKMVESGTDENCDSAAIIALAIVHNSSESAEDKADAMFMLGQVARFLQPWRCPDDGVSWFRSALKQVPTHLPSLLALCEISVWAVPMDSSTLDELAPQVEAIRSSMLPGHEMQWADVRRRMAGYSQNR